MDVAEALLPVVFGNWLDQELVANRKLDGTTTR